MTIMYPYYGNVEPKQLQLFDPDDYLGLDGMYHITVELDDDLFTFISKAAEAEGISVSDWASREIKKYMERVANG